MVELIVFVFGILRLSNSKRFQVTLPLCRGLPGVLGWKDSEIGAKLREKNSTRIDCHRLSSLLKRGVATSLGPYCHPPDLFIPATPAPTPQFCFNNLLSGGN